MGVDISSRGRLARLGGIASVRGDIGPETPIIRDVVPIVTRVLVFVVGEVGKRSRGTRRTGQLLSDGPSTWSHGIV